MGRPDRRITKAERKQLARLERERLERKMAAARRNRRIVVGIGALAVVAVIAFLLTRPEPVRADPKELLARSQAAADRAGCGDPEDVGPYQPQERDQAHVTAEEMPALSTYPSIPPASGPHGEIPLPSGVYDSPPPMDRLIHSLEHGAAVVWYAPDATEAELEPLVTFFEDDEFGDRVIVAPYDYPGEQEAGSLPSGVRMALVAWHVVESCADIDLAAAFGFTARYAAPPFGDEPYLGSAPEAGAVF
jgi:hypothetical protein